MQRCGKADKGCGQERGAGSPAADGDPGPRLLGTGLWVSHLPRPAIFYM